jgi:thiol-disulfide isomerase/thioredoxin
VESKPNEVTVQYANNQVHEISNQLNGNFENIHKQHYLIMKTLVMISFLFFPFIAMQAQNVRNFQLRDLGNVQRSFDELKGERLTLIDFWASWCGPCLKSIPELNHIYETYKEKGVEIIGINCDGPRSISKVAPMVRSMKIQYPVLVDLNSDVKNELNLMAFPSLIIVDSAGKILWIHEGFVTGDTEVIKAEIDKHLNKTTP